MTEELKCKPHTADFAGGLAKFEVPAQKCWGGAD